MSENKYRLNTEQQLTENYSLEINDFWSKSAQFNTFESKHGGTINTVLIKTGNSKAIVIVQGRNESVLKYKEVAFDLNKQGYDLFLIDHRGQGFSTRLGGDPHRGHIENFEYYIADLSFFVDSLQLSEHYHSRFLLSHSMGGAISALYLQKQQHPFQATIFINPMFSVGLRGIPTFIAKVISYSSDRACKLFSKLACYAPKSKPYRKIPFQKNQLTSSLKRYSSAFSTFQQSPETQLGGPTMRWVNESLFAMEKAINNATRINIPLLLLQSGADTVVTADGQQHFSEKANLSLEALIHIENAKHELLLEQDKYRIPALTTMLDFFEAHQKGETTCTK